MPGRVSIKKMTSPLKMVGGCALIMIAFLFQAASVSAADQLTKIQIADDLSPGLMYLLKLADPNLQESFQPDKIKTRIPVSLLRF